MGNNSIRSNLSKEDIISDIRMSLSANFDKTKAVLVVEGPDDRQFWQNKTSDNVYLYESFSGIAGVKEIVEFFNSNSVIGICDKDYATSSQNLMFYYDYCCLEMMLVYSDSAFTAFISEYCPCKNSNVLRLSILLELQWLSSFRRLNSTNLWGVKFKGLSIHNSCDNENECFDKQKALSELIVINRKCCNISDWMLAEVLQESQIDMSLVELLSITNGHDFLSFLHFLYINKGERKGRVHGVDAISASLRCAFRMTDFFQTTLYAKLKEYEHTSGLLFLVE